MLFYKVYIKLTDKCPSPSEIRKKSKEFYRIHGNDHAIAVVDISCSKKIGILCVAEKDGSFNKSSVKEYLAYINTNAVVTYSAEITYTKYRLLLNDSIKKNYSWG